MVSSYICQFRSGIQLKCSESIYKLRDTDYKYNTIKSKIDLSSVYINQTFSNLNNSVYGMNDGLPQRVSPIFIILAGIYMNNLETKINQEHEHMNGVLLYRLYINNVLTIWNSTNPLDEFMMYINGISNSISNNSRYGIS